MSNPYESNNIAKPQWLIQTIFDLGRHEGFRPYAYPDPLSKLGRKYSLRKWNWGYEPGDVILARLGEKEEDGRPWTVGHGFTKNVRPNTRITLEYSLRRLENELLDHLPVLDKLIPEWKLMPLVIKTVLANMAYNLGYERLSKFAPTLALFKAGDYRGAGARLKKSAWYKQTGVRAQELIKRLETGQIEKKYLVVADQPPLPDFSNVTGRVTSTEDIIGDDKDE